MTTPDLKELKMVCGAKAIVDSDVYEIAKGKRWRLDRYGYPQWTSSKNYKSYSIRLHNLVIKAPAGMHTDHINTDKLDNRRSNLRIATCSQNGANQKIRKGGTSKYKGVHWKKETKKWCASIRVNGKSLHLGYYKNEDDAGLVYDHAASSHFGEFAKLNTALLEAVNDDS